MITDPGTGIDNEPPLPIYDITLTELDIAGGPNPQLRWMCKKMCPPGNGQEKAKKRVIKNKSAVTVTNISSLDTGMRMYIFSEWKEHLQTNLPKTAGHGTKKI